MTDRRNAVTNGGLAHSVVCAVAIAVIVVLAPALSMAQLTRSAVSGTVKDTSGGVVPGATITITNVDTNAARETVTDGDGFFRVGGLEPGQYKVSAALQGFVTIEQSNVAVRSAADISLDFELKPSGVAEVIVVEAQTAALSRTDPTISTTVSSRRVVETPLGGGRNINNLILTIPNAVSTTGQGTFAVNGNRPRNNNFMIDGSDNNDISVTIATSQVVPEAVAEFQVLQNPYQVEFGRNSGGQINVITKSGTNRFDGDAWDYYTSSKYYSLNNIERASGLTTPAQFNRHQMGVDAGGPVLRDKVFFYGLFQRDTQRPGARPGGTVRTLTPAGYAALGSVPLGEGQSAASRQAVLGKLAFLQNVHSLNPVFRNISTTLVNGVPIETGQTNVNIVDPSTYSTYMGRGDYRLGANDTITFRYHYNDRSDTNAISNCVFGEVFCGNQALLDTNLAASHTRVFSSLLNEFRFSLVRRDLDFPENDPASPTASITGLFQIGGNSNFPQSRITDSYQFSNTSTRVMGRHTLKAGADIRYLRVDNQAAFNSKGTFTFNSLQDYMNNRAFSLQQALQTASWFATQFQTSMFAQDDFRLTQDLTLNLGLRYEVGTVPLGMLGATDAQSLGALVPGEAKKDSNNWAPRVGFAWVPRSSSPLIGDGQTVIRGGFGIGYDVIFYNLLTVNASNFPRVVTANLNDVVGVYPNLLPATATAVFNPLAVYVNSPVDTQSPESRFYSLLWQREKGPYLFEVGYSGSRGGKGINQIVANPSILTPEQAALVASTRNAGAIPSLQARRLYPQFGNRVLIPAYVGPGGNDVEARSTYNAIFFSGKRRFFDGIEFQASYTYSRWFSNNDASLGEGGTAQSSQRPQDMFDYEAEWSRSQYDRPHRFSASYIWEIPGPDSGILSKVLDGWQITGVTSGQSGQPFTILTGVDSNGDSNTGSDRPNVSPGGGITWDSRHQGFTNNGYSVPLGTNGLPLPNSLGNGNGKRNAERARHFWNTDLSLSKAFPAGPTRLLFRVDAFNIFNHDDYGAPNNNMSSPSFGINGNNWGRRSLNMSVKVTF
jgi:hypothetical protein